MPSLVGGRIEPGVVDGTQLAVAVDGIVRATTETVTRRGASRFSALVHERWLPPGSRRVEIYAIEGGAGELQRTGYTALRPLPDAASSP